MKETDNRPDPSDLLNTFIASERSDSAFCALVESLQNLVYSSARRRTGNAELAEEVTQNVFAIMARKASSLRKHPCLTAWALETTRFQSANAVRREKRQQRKIAALEEEAEPIDSMNDQSTWKDSVPFLDEVIDLLPIKDRKVILQRFYEEKKLKEIARQSGMSEGCLLYTSPSPRD